MALAAYFEDGPHHVQGIFKLSLILEQSQQSGQLLRGEEVFFANLINTTTRDHNKFPVLGDLKPGSLSQLLRADGHSAGKSVPHLVPHDTLELLRLFFVS